jgi:hypothetical protein
MLSHCANSQCRKPFLKLRDGKLFLVEINRVARLGKSLHPAFVRAHQQQRTVEHFWLCEECATRWSIVYDRDQGIMLTPLRRPLEKAAPNTSKSGAA